MSNYALGTRIVRVTDDSVFLENLEIEDGIPFHISVRLSRMDSDDGEEWYQSHEDPSEMAQLYHENYGIMVNRYVWNDVIKKHEPDGKPPIKDGLTYDWFHGVSGRVLKPRANKRLAPDLKPATARPDRSARTRGAPADLGRRSAKRLERCRLELELRTRLLDPLNAFVENRSGLKLDEPEPAAADAPPSAMAEPAAV